MPCDTSLNRLQGLPGYEGFALVNSLSLHGVGVGRDEAKRIGLVGFQIVFSESHVQAVSTAAFPPFHCPDFLSKVLLV
jgi:hypothetical protein